MKDPYQILQVSRNASPEEIEEAYLTQILKNPFSDKDTELMQAYEFLLEKSQKNPPKNNLASAKPNKIISHPLDKLIEEINKKELF